MSNFLVFINFYNYKYDSTIHLPKEVPLKFIYSISFLSIFSTALANTDNLKTSPVCYNSSTHETEITTCNFDEFDLNHVYKNSTKFDIEYYKNKQLITFETSNGLKFMVVCGDSICKQHNEYQEAKSDLMDKTISRNKRNSNFFIIGRKSFKIRDKTKDPESKFEDRTLEYMKVKALFTYDLVKNDLETEQRKKEEERRRAQEIRTKGSRDSPSDRGGRMGRTADRPGGTPGSAGERLGRTAR
jgi:hypothetical protein